MGGFPNGLVQGHLVKPLDLPKMRSRGLKSYFRPRPCPPENLFGALRCAPWASCQPSEPLRPTHRCLERAGSYQHYSALFAESRLHYAQNNFCVKCNLSKKKPAVRAYEGLEIGRALLEQLGVAWNHRPDILASTTRPMKRQLPSISMVLYFSLRGRRYRYPASSTYCLKVLSPESSISTT